jgi:hypothetical protein
MPPKRSNNNSRQSIARVNQGTFLAAGISLTDLTMTSTSSTFRYNSFAVGAATMNSLRLSSLSDAYGAYRFQRLKVTVFKNTTTPDTSPAGIAVGYSPVIPNNVQGTIYDIMEMQASTFFMASQTVPSTFNVIRKGMNGFLTRWLKTRATASDDLFEYQGSIVYGCNNSTSNPTVTLKFEWVVEFKDPLSTAFTVSRPVSNVDVVEEKESWSDVVVRGNASSGTSTPVVSNPMPNLLGKQPSRRLL